ncbi:MAG TPA: hypothetical protein HPP66_04105 [Planctomycetes bacterium]|nr:hypothetical protein [Planctomycetota bacterium]
MRRSGQKFSRSQILIVALAVVVTLWIGGCGDFVPYKTAGRESNSILDDLGKIQTTPEANIPMPSVYTGPPIIREQIVGGVSEFKLFYFCRHLTSPELEAVVHKQFATLVFNAKGKSTAVKDYTVSSVAATNQLIVRCPTRNDVDAVLELLEHVDIPPIQVKIDCLISEIYADKTLDWETTLEIENLLGESIWAGPAGRPFGEAIMELVEDGATIAAFPGASLRELARARMGLKVGYLSKDHKFLSLVDLLESHGYLKILMHPSLEVVNGKMAKISSSQRVPVDKTYLHSAQSEFFTTKTEWADVIDSLQITPHVFADGYIGLETKIMLGSKLTPEGIKQINIVTKKEIQNAENRIRPGESLIIGGLRKTERRDVVRGIPFLKDIPILGILFSGRDFEERAVETIFILTPSFSTGGIPNKEMMEEVERKQGTSKTGVQEIMQEAEQTRLEAEAEKAEARAATREAEEQARKAEADAQKATTETEKATAAEQQAKIEAEKAKAVAKIATEKAAATEKQAKAETEKAVAEAKIATEKSSAVEKQAQAQIAKLTAETEKLKAEAEIAKADAQKATAEVEKAKADAQKATAEAEIAKAEAEKATVDAATTKAEAEKLAAEAEKAKTEAEKARADAATTKAEAEKLAAEAQKAKADAEKATAKAEARAKQETAEKPKEGAEKLKAEAEKARADAQRLMAEAEKAKEEAEAKAKVAEKAKAKADAKAKAAEEAKEAGKTKTRAEKNQKKGKAKKDRVEAEKPKARAKKRKEEAAKKARAKREAVETERRQRNKQKQPKWKPKRPKKGQNKTNELSG